MKVSFIHSVGQNHSVLYREVYYTRRVLFQMFHCNDDITVNLTTYRGI